MKKVKISPISKNMRQSFENFELLAKTLIAGPNKELSKTLDDYKT